MNKYFYSQIIYDRFKLYADNKNISAMINNLKKEVKAEDIPQSALNRILARNVNYIKH